MMKISMNLPDDHQYSIMQRVLDGTLAIESVDEFNEILDIYPDDPILRRKYADLLVERSDLDKAMVAFDEASRMFIERGMNLQAIVSKILQWGIQKPTHAEGKAFQKLLSTKGAQHTPLQRFWAGLSYPQLVTIMLRLVRVRLATGEKIACVDDPANEIYFVVGGTLAETMSPECQMEASRAGVELEPILLGANDLFGNIFPLDRPTTSYTDVVAVTEVELVKISKPVLCDACRKYPTIETLLKDIHKPDNVEKCDRAWQMVRRAVRYGLPTKVEISPSAGDRFREDFLHTGIALDLSLGGMCIDLGPETDAHRHFKKSIAVDMTLDLLNEVAVLNLTGKIVWHREHTTDKGKSTYIGIRFDALHPTDRELLIEYCSGSVGEQNLLWSLWDSLIKPEGTDQPNEG